MAGGVPAALVSLAEWADGRSVEVLAGAMRVSHSRAVRVVDRLEAAGLARREADPSDGRRALVWLEPAGREAGRARARGPSRVLLSAVAGLECRRLEGPRTAGRRIARRDDRRRACGDGRRAGSATRTPAGTTGGLPCHPGRRSTAGQRRDANPRRRRVVRARRGRAAVLQRGRCRPQQHGPGRRLRGDGARAQRHRGLRRAARPRVRRVLRDRRVHGRLLRFGLLGERRVRRTASPSWSATPLPARPASTSTSCSSSCSRSRRRPSPAR